MQNESHLQQKNLELLEKLSHIEEWMSLTHEKVDVLEKRIQMLESLTHKLTDPKPKPSPISSDTFDYEELRENLNYSYRGNAGSVGPRGVALMNIVIDKMKNYNSLNFVEILNSELLTGLEISSADALNNIRKKCIKTGQLEYKTQGTRRPGLYKISQRKYKIKFKQD